MKFKCGGLLFTSDFDSGNLDKVEYVEPENISKGESSLPPISNRCIRRQKSQPESPFMSPVHSKKYQLKNRTLYSKLKSTVSAESVCAGIHQQIREFKIWTKPDCGGTPHQTTFRTWFYFGITGGPPGLLVKINVMNLNRQGKLYFHGMKPVYKIVPSKDNGWKRIPGKVDFKCALDGNFTISFCHALPSDQDSVIYFAFTFPFSYSECQKMLDDIDDKVGSSLHISKNDKSQESALYYCRELLCTSSAGNRIEVLTISSCKGLTAEREKRLEHLFPDASKPRCHIFQDKKIVFISSRVHPGETPSSFVFNGMLHYLIGSKDTSANRLRNLFVFKLIPMLNPDGVLNGHYRADLQGLNLNRLYMIADLQQHPSIYAARTLLLYYHTHYATPAVNKKHRLDTNPALRSVTINQRTHQKQDSCLKRNTTNQKQTREGIPKVISSFQRRQRNAPTKLNLKVPDSPTTKKLSKEILNQMEKKTAKHSLHTCEVLTRNLNFLSSIPAVLPTVATKNAGMICDSFQEPDSNVPAKSFNFCVTPPVMGFQAEEEIVKSSVMSCSECKQFDYPSKKITLEGDPCSCVEASDADDSSSVDCEARLCEGDASKLLDGVPCLRPEESGIAYYFDLHGHASKRGCFIYGNYFQDIDKMVDCMFLPKLMSINCPYFDFAACNFSAENMFSGSNSNVQSKEGSGRVSLYVLTGIIHSYTLECNYNTCRFTTNEKRRPTSDVPSQVFFTPEIYHQIGESLLVSLLDAVGCNPRSQVSSSRFLSVQGVREWLKQHALSLRGRCGTRRITTTLPGSRASDKALTRSMTIRRSLFSSANKGLRQESSSSNTNLSSNASDSEARISPVLNKTWNNRVVRGTRSLLSSPVSKRMETLQRRHTFVQDAPRKTFRRSHAGRNSTA